MIHSFFKWVLDLTRLGVISDYEDDGSMRTVFSNVIFISLPVVYLIIVLIDYDSYIIPIQELRFDQLVVPIIIVICILGLWLNRLGKSKISRILFLSLWPFLLHIIPIKLLNTPPDYYLAFPFGIVFHAMLIQLMFSYRSEWKFFYFFMVLNFISMLLSPKILYHFDLDHDIPEVMVNHKYYFYDGILYWMLFNLVTFYILYVIESYIKRTANSKALIEKQKEELKGLNQNLEALVSHRTLELEEQYDKLQQHAFFNAHLLRGPFCRVKGLIYLKALTKEESIEQKDINMRLTESIEELDARIQEIQKLVETK